MARAMIMKYCRRRGAKAGEKTGARAGHERGACGRERARGTHSQQRRSAGVERGHLRGARRRQTRQQLACDLFYFGRGPRGRATGRRRSRLGRMPRPRHAELPSPRGRWLALPQRGRCRRHVPGWLVGARPSSRSRGGRAAGSWSLAGTTSDSVRTTSVLSPEGLANAEPALDSRDHIFLPQTLLVVFNPMRTSGFSYGVVDNVMVRAGLGVRDRVRA